MFRFKAPKQPCLYICFLYFRIVKISITTVFSIVFREESVSYFYSKEYLAIDLKCSHFRPFGSKILGHDARLLRDEQHLCRFVFRYHAPLTTEMTAILSIIKHTDIPRCHFSASYLLIQRTPP